MERASCVVSALLAAGIGCLVLGVSACGGDDCAGRGETCDAHAAVPALDVPDCCSGLSCVVCAQAATPGAGSAARCDYNAPVGTCQ
jgi:hypothetical protein